MDEQTHKRLRQRGEETQQALREESEHVYASEQAPQSYTKRDGSASGDGQTHRRRRLTAGTDAIGEQVNDQHADVRTEDEDLFWRPETQKNQDMPPEKERAAQNKLLKAVSAADDIVCKIADACLAALKWAGIALLFVVGFVVNGMKSIIAASRTRSSGADKESRRLGEKQFAEKTAYRKEARIEQTEFTIIPTRPEDYRGMGSKRAAEGKHLRLIGRIADDGAHAQRARTGLAYSALMAVFLCVALFSAYQIGSIVWRSVSTKRLSNTLSERYSELSGDQEEEDSPANGNADEAASIPSPDAEKTPAVVYVNDVFTEEQAADSAVIAQATAAPVHKDAVLSTRFHQVGGDALPEMEALYQENRDLIGWLRMEGILDLPVVYRDNKYYLTRDFYRNKSASGTLFLDENHPFRENAQNLLLHGHNMKDGTMFGRLVQYETNLQFLKNNPFIQYSTLWRKEQYVIFSVMRVSLDTRSDEFFNYFTHHTFSSDAQFENYVRALQNRSAFSIPVDVDPSDALLTLSTCLNDDRLVIVARRLREGESKSELRHFVQLANRQ